uniref:Uncharacterized protein n=1 Tax=Picea glauca TaxID=3330 RepID=A0A124GMJ1_PICGL|nr:hypothetical protein ABT39_MTgene2182 [Picea glauca]QHR88057.1 hypothetical protein Q903MT_gene2069 [Picea sitchensis]
MRKVNAPFTPRPHASAKTSPHVLNKLPMDLPPMDSSLTACLPASPHLTSHNVRCNKWNQSMNHQVSVQAQIETMVVFRFMSRLTSLLLFAGCCPSTHWPAASPQKVYGCFHPKLMILMPVFCGHLICHPYEVKG